MKLYKNDPDSMYDWIANKISSREFRNKIKNFIDEHCSIFLDENDNSFQHGLVFKDMNILLEQLLKSLYEEGNITQEDYLKALQRSIADKKYRKYFNQIEKFRDYSFFRSEMVKRNIQLMKLAESQINSIKKQNNNNNERKAQITPELLAQIFSNNENEIKEIMIQSNIEEGKEKTINLSLVHSKKEQLQKERDDKDKKEEKKKKEQQKKNLPAISSIIGFEICREEKYEENRLEPKALSNKENEFKIKLVDEKHNNNINNLDNEIYKSLMPAPIIKVQPRKEEKNKELLEKIGYEENKIEKSIMTNKPEKDEKIENINIYDKNNSKLERLEHKLDNENSFCNEENLEFGKKRNNNNERLYYLPGSINENRSKSYDENH